MTTRTSKFLAVLGVREDDGMIGPCVDNLRRIGFDFVVLVCVEDFASKTQELARLYESDPAVSVIDLPETVNENSIFRFSGPLFGPLLDRYEAEWLLVSDVDEFPIVRGGCLEHVRDLDTADLLIIDRYNHARLRGQSGAEILAMLGRPGTLPLLMKRGNEQSKMRDGDAPRWIRHNIAPKVLVRPHRFDGIAPGTHGVLGWRGEGDGPVKIRSDEIAIAHVPFTSFERFEQKVSNAQAHLNGNTIHESPNSAWHWKWWIRRLEEGALSTEFAREALSNDEFERMRALGEVRTGEEIVGGLPSGAKSCASR